MRKWSNFAKFHAISFHENFIFFAKTRSFAKVFSENEKSHEIWQWYGMHVALGVFFHSYHYIFGSRTYKNVRENTKIAENSGHINDVDYLGNRA
jgi:hypothetical protein